LIDLMKWDEYFLFEQFFVFIRVLRGCPAVPNAADHLSISPYKVLSLTA
jgi:hypothetical protein